ncbi:MAG: LysM peptidoglycan-binding domain-containing protein [Lachnospiraceae bacterium]
MDNYYGNICYCRRCNGVVHTIKKGDTLYLISKYYKVPIGEIMGANRNINVYNLQIGDEICIPVRRPEPREMEQIDNGINIMNRNAGNTMNDNNSNMASYEDTETQPVMGSMAGYMDDYEADSQVSDGMDSSAEAVSAQTSDINKLKVSELIGEKDMTVEELAGLLKKYM